MRNKNLNAEENYKITKEMLEAIGVDTDKILWTTIADISHEFRQVIDMNLEGKGCIIESK